MDYLYPFLPFVGAVAFLVAWLWFTTWLGVRSMGLDDLLAGNAVCPVLGRVVLFFGWLMALLGTVYHWVFKRDPGHWWPVALMLSLVVLTVFLGVFWLAAGTRKLSLQDHLMLNIKLRRMDTAGEVVENPEVAALLGLRVEERVWFHRWLFARRGLRLDDVLDRVCPTASGSNG